MYTSCSEANSLEDNASPVILHVPNNFRLDLNMMYSLFRENREKGERKVKGVREQKWRGRERLHVYCQIRGYLCFIPYQDTFLQWSFTSTLIFFFYVFVVLHRMDSSLIPGVLQCLCIYPLSVFSHGRFNIPKLRTARKAEGLLENIANAKCTCMCRLYQVMTLTD